MDEHVKLADEDMQPIMYKWKTRPWHELFSRPVHLQVEEEIGSLIIKKFNLKGLNRFD
jgi:hypothetical protein